MPALLVPVITAIATAVGVTVSATVANIIAQVIFVAAMAGLAYALRPRQKAQHLTATVFEPDADRFRIYGARATAGVVRFYEAEGTWLGFSIIVNCDRVAEWIDLEVDGRHITPTSQAVQDAGAGSQVLPNGSSGDFEVWEGAGARLSGLIGSTFPDLSPSTDGCRGFSAVHLVFAQVKAEKRATVFPNGARPQIRVTAKFTPVWDPRDDTQSWATNSTWKASDNPIIQALDFVQHPDGMRRPQDMVDINSFVTAAAYCDRVVAARYENVLVSEPWARCSLEYNLGEDRRSVMARFMATCDGYWYENAAGQIAVGIMQWVEPTVTITDADFSYFMETPLESLETSVNEIRAKYTEASRNYALIDAPIAAISALVERDGLRRLDVQLAEVTAPSQAYRLETRQLRRRADKRNVTLRMGPSALWIAWKVKKNGVFVVQIASNYFPLLNGVYDVLAVQPENATLERWTITLRETTPDIYEDPVPDWDPAYVLPLAVNELPPAPAITVSNPVDTDYLQIRTTISSDPTTAIEEGSWTLFAQYRASGAADWLDCINYGPLLCQTPDLAVGAYDVQAFWVTGIGAQGAAATATGTVSTSPVPNAPTAATATGSTGAAVFTGTADMPDPYVVALQFWFVAHGGGFGAAVTIGGPVPCVAGGVASQAQMHAAGSFDLFVTARNSAGVDSPPFGPINYTIT